MRKMMLAANWKMHGSCAELAALASAIVAGANTMAEEFSWVLCPAFPYLSMISECLKSSVVALGAQNMSEHASGAYTGEVAASMLQDCHCQYVILGHSERRQLYQETNQLVARKCQAALNAGLAPIICVGETLEQRQAGVTQQIVQEQLEVVLSLQDNPNRLKQAVIAYEPVWAIGTGQVATAEQAQEVHAAIRATLAEFGAELATTMRILYGGSVKPGNAAELLAMPDIDGALVGGASLKAESFIEIGKNACNSYS